MKVLLVNKYFYLKGWRGINIEPDVNFFKKFEVAVEDSLKCE